MKKSKKTGISFFMIMMALSVIPLIFSVLVISISSIMTIKNNLESKAEETLYIVASNLANHCRENNISYATSANYNDYLDSLQNRQIEMAIILTNAPCVTSIKNESGYRIREIDLIKDIANDADVMNGYFEKNVIIDGKVYLAYYMPIITNNELIGFAFSGQLETGVTTAIKRVTYSFIIIALILTVLLVAVSFLCSKRISKILGRVKEEMNALSEGNMTRKNQHSSGIVELNQLLLATGKLQLNLSGIIGKVKETAQTLICNIADVTELSANSTDKASEITTAVSELTITAEGMSENVQEISEQMNETGQCIKDIVENVEQLSLSSDHILQINHVSKDNIYGILNNSRKSVQAMNEITDQIKDANESIKKINSAVQLILSIAEQLNLLSLNASIEAARAGEQGKGFSVVAEEIRKLSGQSAEGAEEIRILAQTIIDKSQNSVVQAEAVQNLIISEQREIKNTQGHYEELSDDIDCSVEKIKEIFQKTEKLSKYKEKIIVNISELSAISEENAASNEAVNGNIIDIQVSVKNVNNHCETMIRKADELKEAVAFFNN